MSRAAGPRGERPEQVPLLREYRVSEGAGVNRLAQAIIKQGIGNAGGVLTYKDQFRLIEHDKEGGFGWACWYRMKAAFRWTVGKEKTLTLSAEEAEKCLADLKESSPNLTIDSPEVKFLASKIIAHKQLPSYEELQTEWQRLVSSGGEITMLSMGRLFLKVSKALDDYKDIYEGIGGRDEQDEIVQLTALKKAIEYTFNTDRCPREQMEFYARENPLHFIAIYRHLEDPDRESKLWQKIWENQVQVNAKAAEGIGAGWKMSSGLTKRKDELARLEQEIDRDIMQLPADSAAALEKHNKVVLQEQGNIDRLTKELVPLRNAASPLAALQVAKKEAEIEVAKNKMNASSEEFTATKKLAADLATYRTVKESKDDAGVRLALMQQQLKEFSDPSSQAFKALSLENRKKGIEKFTSTISELEEEIKRHSLQLEQLRKALTSDNKRAAIAKKVAEAEVIRSRLPAAEAHVASLYANEQSQVLVNEYIRMYVCNAAFKRMERNRDLSLESALTLTFIEDENNDLKRDLQAELIRLGIDVTRFPWKDEYDKIHKEALLFVKANSII